MAHHPISHIEIPAENPNEVSAFYRDAFGWKIETNAEHNYVTYQDGGSLRGGFPGPGEPTYKSDRLLVYLATDDIDASLADGWWAVFADPAGNHIGLFARRSTSK